jgi:phospholysine phosphohistidine inorganic pyrophosphate phosphatase
MLLFGAMEALRGVRGLVIDLDGTLYVGDHVLPGVREALAALRAIEIPMRFLTNTTSKPLRAMVEKLGGLGLEIGSEEIFTAPRVAAQMLRERQVKRAYFLLKGSVVGDMDGIEAVDEHAQAVVIGDLRDEFSIERLNRAFQLLLEDADFYALAENRMYRTSEGMCLDVGAFVRALEYSTRRKAVLLGKPSRAFFEVAVAALGVPPHEVASVGDDLEGDVAGGQGAGLKGVLVRTGKFRADDLSVSDIRPDAVIDSFAELPAWLGNF